MPSARWVRTVFAAIVVGGGRGARATAVATRCARASRRGDGRSRAFARPRQPRDDGLRRVREPAGRQRAVAGSASAVEMDRRARCRAHLRPAQRARHEPRPARLAVSVRDRAAVGSHEPGADRRRGARSSRAGAARGARCRDAARARQRRRRIHGRAVHDRARRHAVARDRSRDEAARLGAVDRPEHDARRHHDDHVLHGLSAVRRPAVARRHHGGDGLARHDVDDVPRRLVPQRRQPTCRTFRRPRRRRRLRSAVQRRRRSPTKSGTCASAATAAPSSSSRITS